MSDIWLTIQSGNDDFTTTSSETGTKSITLISILVPLFVIIIIVICALCTCVAVKFRKTRCINSVITGRYSETADPEYDATQETFGELSEHNDAFDFEDIQPMTEQQDNITFEPSQVLQDSQEVSSIPFSPVFTSGTHDTTVRIPENIISVKQSPEDIDHDIPMKRPLGSTETDHKTPMKQALGSLDTDHETPMKQPLGPEDTNHETPLKPCHCVVDKEHEETQVKQPLGSEDTGTRIHYENVCADQCYDNVGFYDAAADIYDDIYATVDRSDNIYIAFPDQGPPSGDDEHSEVDVEEVEEPITEQADEEVPSFTHSTTLEETLPSLVPFSAYELPSNTLAYANQGFVSETNDTTVQIPEEPPVTRCYNQGDINHTTLMKQPYYQEDADHETLVKQHHYQENIVCEETPVKQPINSENANTESPIKQHQGVQNTDPLIQKVIPLTRPNLHMQQPQNPTTSNEESFVNIDHGNQDTSDTEHIPTSNEGNYVTGNHGLT